MSSFESSNQYLIERFLSSELSRFSSNFKIGTWDQIIVRSNSDTLFPKTYDKNDGNQVSVFTIKERLLRLFKRDINYEIYKINLSGIVFSINKEIDSNSSINLEIVVSITESLKDISNLSPVQKKQKKILEIQNFILSELSINEILPKQALLDKRYEINDINQSISQLIEKKYIKINNDYYEPAELYPHLNPSMPSTHFYLPQLISIAQNNQIINNKDLTELCDNFIISKIIDPVFSNHMNEDINNSQNQEKIKNDIEIKFNETFDKFLKKYALKSDSIIVNFENNNLNDYPKTTNQVRDAKEIRNTNELRSPASIYEVNIALENMHSPFKVTFGSTGKLKLIGKGLNSLYNPFPDKTPGRIYNSFIDSYNPKNRNDTIDHEQFRSYSVADIINGISYLIAQKPLRNTRVLLDSKTAGIEQLNKKSSLSDENNKIDGNTRLDSTTKSNSILSKISYSFLFLFGGLFTLGGFIEISELNDHPKVIHDQLTLAAVFYSISGVVFLLSGYIRLKRFKLLFMNTKKATIVLAIIGFIMLIIAIENDPTV